MGKREGMSSQQQANKELIVPARGVSTIQSSQAE